MTNFFKAALLGTAAIASLSATPALAQRGNAAPAAPVVAVADTDGAIAGSNAYTVAMQQIQTTYAAQLQQLQARETALQTELRTLQQTAITEQNRQPRNQQAYDAAVRAFQTRQQAAQQELRTLGQPIELARSYVIEQISLRMNEAFEAARRARGAAIVLRPDAVLTADNSVNITQAITTELNRLVPNVQIVPPQGYQPGSLLQAQQRQAAGQPAAPGTPTPTPAPAQPQTR